MSALDIALVNYGIMTDNICLFYIAECLKKHIKSVEEHSIKKIDCAHVFRVVPFNDQDETLRELWRLIGQCLSRVCSKRCSWSNVEVRAAAPNVCNFTTVAEEVVVYWLFVSEGEDWVNEFQTKETQPHSGTGGEDGISSNSGSQRKKSGTHKSIEYLKHWYQLRSLVEERRAKRGISESWDDAWRQFANEDIEMTKKKKGTRKRSIKDVLPTFEDVLGVGETLSSYSSGIVLDDDLQLCTQTSAV